ncbi:transposase [Corynebacterium diphtheriae]|nr:transposase [Corynebacterium diphtheriae]
MYRIGIELGLWQRNPHGRRTSATSRRCEYLMLRFGAMNRKDTAKAVSINPRETLNIDKGVTKLNGVGRVPCSEGVRCFVCEALIQKEFH